jgi:NAD(P)-dependent dehydrogenase (short-subunit alcohol dehydrogenase family)
MNLVKLACERYGKLDVLVSNAGIGPISAFDDLRVEDWELSAQTGQRPREKRTGIDCGSRTASKVRKLAPHPPYIARHLTTA